MPYVMALQSHTFFLPEMRIIYVMPQYVFFLKNVRSMPLLPCHATHVQNKRPKCVLTTGLEAIYSRRLRLYLSARVVLLDEEKGALGEGGDILFNTQYNTSIKAITTLIPAPHEKASCSPSPLFGNLNKNFLCSAITRDPIIQWPRNRRRNARLSYGTWQVSQKARLL